MNKNSYLPVQANIICLLLALVGTTTIVTLGMVWTCSQRCFSFFGIHYPMLEPITPGSLTMIAMPRDHDRIADFGAIAKRITTKVTTLNSLLLLTALMSGAVQAEERFITVGSATSVQDSGLMGYIVPIFWAATGVNVHVKAVGTGQALAMGERGDADALILQDRAGEEKFVAEGYGFDRRDVMHNDFVIVGPSSDPAGIRGLRDALSAFALIAAKGALFVSRGDGGGTYVMERRLWRSAGIDPAGQPWYRSEEEGVGATLNLAAAADAYALADRATWANLRNKQSLAILTEGDPILFNLYGSILVSPTKLADVKFSDAKMWHQWLTSRAGLDAIKSYRIGGKEMFFSPRLPL
jgi:tungstate transport system substrate-binding protein